MRAGEPGPLQSDTEGRSVLTASRVVVDAAAVAFDGLAFFGFPPRARIRCAVEGIAGVIEHRAVGRGRARGDRGDEPGGGENRLGALAGIAGRSGGATLLVLPLPGVAGDLAGQLVDVASQACRDREAGV